MAAYNLIATTTVGSGGASTIEFSSIPQTFTDILLVASLRGDAAVNYQTGRMYINGSASNMGVRTLYGAGGSVGSSTISAYMHIGDTLGSSSTASTFSSHNIYLPNYTSSNYKSLGTEAVTGNNSSTFYVNGLFAGLWSQTSSITSLSLYPESGSWVQYSSASLYGIKNS